MSLNQSRKGYPLIDPDLSIGKEHGYRDPYRHAQVRVTEGAPQRRPYKPRTYRKVTSVRQPP